MKNIDFCGGNISKIKIKKVPAERESFLVDTTIEN